MEFGALVDAALGVLAVVILFSLGASAINEFIADNLTRLRGRTLAKGIEQLLAKRTGLEGKDLKKLVADFYDDPSIRALMEGDRRPSAIEPRRYALTALKLVTEWDTARIEAQRYLEAVKRELSVIAMETSGNLGAPEAGAQINRRLEETLDGMAEVARSASAEAEEFVRTLEAEFNEAMDRVSGWYVRRTKLNLFVIGLILAVGSNLDLLRYADRMMTQEALSKQVDTARALFGDEEFQSTFLAAAGSAGGAESAKLAAPAGAEEAVPASADAAPPPGGAATDPFGVGQLNREIGTLAASLGELDVQIGWDCKQRVEDARVLTWRWLESRGWTKTENLWCDNGTVLPAPKPSQMVGWFLIAFAVTLGAQFWFDLFKRIVHLRTAGITGAVASEQAASPSG